MSNQSTTTKGCQPTTNQGNIAGIKNWPIDERPREKLLKRGPGALTNSELLAILLRTGVAPKSAIDLAREIFQKFGTFRNMSHTDMREWKDIRGLGPAKITQIMAALEIGRRFREDEVLSAKQKITSAQDIVDIMLPQIRDLKTEVSKVIYLNSDNRIIFTADAAIGTVNEAMPIIREIFHTALQKFAATIICVHNHPSGNIKPSPEDERFTRELSAAGKLMGIKVLDHIIIGGDSFYSFADDGALE